MPILTVKSSEVFAGSAYLLITWKMSWNNYWVMGSSKRTVQVQLKASSKYLFFYFLNKLFQIVVFGFSISNSRDKAKRMFTVKSFLMTSFIIFHFCACWIGWSWMRILLNNFNDFLSYLRYPTLMRLWCFKRGISCMLNLLNIFFVMSLPKEVYSIELSSH